MSDFLFDKTLIDEKLINLRRNIKSFICFLSNTEKRLLTYTELNFKSNSDFVSIQKDFYNYTKFNQNYVIIMYDSIYQQFEDCKKQISNLQTQGRTKYNSNIIKFHSVDFKKKQKYMRELNLSILKEEARMMEMMKKKEFIIQKNVDIRMNIKELF